MTLNYRIKPGLIKGPLFLLRVLPGHVLTDPDCSVPLRLHVCVEVVDVGHHDLRRSQTGFDETQRKCVLLIRLNYLRVARDLLFAIQGRILRLLDLGLLSK